jgi:hypothetical protein
MLKKALKHNDLPTDFETWNAIALDAYAQPSGA